MPRNRITLTLEGIPDEEGHIRVDAFTRQLQSFVSLIKETDHDVSDSRQSSFYLRVTGLSHNSPSTVTLEAIPKEPDRNIFNHTVTRFVDIYEDVQQEKSIGIVDYRLLEALQNFVKPIGKTIQSVTVALDSRVLSVTNEFGAKVNLAVAPEETFPGEIRGMLEYINLHDDARTFRIYPDIGPSRLNCVFPEELTDKAVSGIRKFVEVRGQLKQKKVADFPNEIEVEDIEIFPPEDELPTLSDLRGIAPDATGGLSSEEFIREIRSKH